MFTVKVENLHMHVTVHNIVEPERFNEILTQLADVRKDIKEFRIAMKLTDQELKDLLEGLDASTNQTATNVQTISDVTLTIKTEMDTFIESNAGTTLDDAKVTQLQGIAARAKAAADAGVAQVSVLQAVAAEGQPVTPPPPPPVVIPTPPQP